MKTFLELVRDKLFKKEIILKDPQTVVITDLVKEISDHKEKGEFKSKYDKLLSELNLCKRQLDTSKSKNESLSKEIKKLIDAAEKRNKKIKILEAENKELKSDCEEAASLLSLKEKGELINIKKTYKIDHFPKDVQDFIYDLIKEYYNAN
jgi:chromosome segregation ATPase